MKESKFLLKQKGIELQAILDREVFITSEEFEKLEETNSFEDGKVYFVIES